MTKFIDQGAVEEKRDLFNGKVTSSHDVYNRQELMACVQEYILACRWLSINPLETLRKLFPAFTWRRVEISLKTTLDPVDSELKRILREADYFWGEQFDEHMFVARRKDFAQPAWRIFGSLDYEHGTEDHWDRLSADFCQRLKSAGAVHCPD